MSIVMISWLNKKSDLLGIISSALCLVHCLALPFLVSFRVLSEDGNEWVEAGFLLVCLLAVWRGAKGATVPVQITLGIFLWGLAFGILGEGETDWAEPLLYGSSVGLVLTHGLNLWQKRKSAKERAKLPASH